MRRSGEGYLTTAPLFWEVGRPGSGLIYVVPQDFWFDVSVPSLIQWLFSPHDPRYLRAAALHDHMLQAGWRRVMAGAVFAEALREDGVGRFTRLIMWLTVSIWKWH